MDIEKGNLEEQNSLVHFRFELSRNWSNLQADEKLNLTLVQI